MKDLLYIDDLRTPCNYIQNHYNIIIARTFKDAINELNKRKYKVIDLDHDLGEEKTGYDICKYIIENDIKITRVYIHSSNPVGRFNMYQLLHRYCKCDIIPY
jgi:hypothetical protein